MTEDLRHQLKHRGKCSFRVHTSNNTSIGIDKRPSSAPVFPFPFVRFLGVAAVVPPRTLDAAWSVLAIFLGLFFPDIVLFIITDGENKVSIVSKVVEFK